MSDVFKEFITEYAAFEGKTEDAYAGKVMPALQMLEQSFFVKIGSWCEIHPTRYHIIKRGNGWYQFAFFGEVYWQNGVKDVLKRPYFVFECFYLPSQNEKDPFKTSIISEISPGMFERTLRGNFGRYHHSFLYALTLLVGSFVKASAQNLRIKQFDDINPGKQVHEHPLDESNVETLRKMGINKEESHYLDIFLEEVGRVKEDISVTIDPKNMLGQSGMIVNILGNTFDLGLLFSQVISEKDLFNDSYVHVAQSVLFHREIFGTKSYITQMMLSLRDVTSVKCWLLIVFVIPDSLKTLTCAFTLDRKVLVKSTEPISLFRDTSDSCRWDIVNAIRHTMHDCIEKLNAKQKK